MEIKKCLTTNNSYDNNDPQAIIVHNTDNFAKTATAKAHATGLRDGYMDKISWHVVVDDKEAYQCLDFHRGAFHIGVNYGNKTLFGKINNRNSICVEMCVNEGYNYKQAFLNTVDVVKQLMASLNIPADRVYQHYDICNKDCPSQIRAHGDWGQFKQLIGGSAPVEEPWYRVRKTWADAASQTGAYHDLTLAKDDADDHPGYSVYDESGKAVYTSKETPYTPSEWISMIAPICVDLAKKNAILPSVVTAQTCLETGFGKTDLTRKYNTTGMKADLINGSWSAYTVWDGTTYEKITPEYHGGQLVYVKDTFRVYKSFREGLEDYEAFLLNVQNSKGYKYRRIQGLTDPATVIHYIRIGTGTDSNPEGYCTDPEYEGKILNLISQYNLTQYDEVMKGKTVKTAVEAAQEMNRIVLQDIKAGRQWVYYNSGQKKTFDLAWESGVYRVNCNLGVIWAYRKIGLFQKTGNFFGKNGKFQMSDSTRKLMLKRFDLIDYGGKHTTTYLVKNGKIKAGDIISFTSMTHTDMYLGNNQWFDTGHAFCRGFGDGAVFKKWVGDNPYPNEKVGEVLRLKEEPATRYRVKVGAYKTTKSANKRALAVTAKSGFDCFIESTDKHRVYCGSFDCHLNAEQRLKELNEKGIKKAKVVTA